MNVLVLSGFFRNLGLLLVFPLPEHLIGVSMRIGIALTLSLPLLDLNAAADSFSPAHVVLELLIGLILGIPLLIGFQALRIWGDLFETLRGHQMGLVIDPLSGGEEQPFALLITYAVTFYLMSNCLLPLLIGISLNSLTQLPPAQLSLALANGLAQSALVVMQSMLSYFLATLLPFAAIVLGIEMLTMVISKVANGISLSGESYLCRMLILLLILALQADYLLAGFVAVITNALPLRQ